ncbi:MULTISPECIES: YdaS family helix-turn-helix protein [unclassified Variovorax]|uniref:transcriptional regulator n=1 Tax=unclassified Variovorax TaxID=663243 RepID=UPI002574DBFF|nr:MULTISPECIES: YdaS family helix-turn-helix protein [unclassified Variovorax]MDM0086766.1 YdaS family helix-turn-helix protein [Variovorax sp. J22G40]MDM0144978.1 YdaS family helix-turn-helix protein [Variovorax sp. J2P1-31]
MSLQTWLEEKRGRGAALAKHLRIPSSMVTKMAKGIKAVPLDQCPYIEDFTRRAVTCEELRPDRVEFFLKLSQRIASEAVPQCNTTEAKTPSLDERLA